MIVKTGQAEKYLQWNLHDINLPISAVLNMHST